MCHVEGGEEQVQRKKEMTQEGGGKIISNIITLFKRNERSEYI